MNVTEILGFVTGALCVWLVARQHIWNWPIGICNNLLYLVVFLRSGLYADAGLQVVFGFLGVYGWWTWQNRDPAVSGLKVTKTPVTTWAWLVALMAATAFLLRFLLSRYTDSIVPGWDGVTTAISLAATYGQCRKLLESWWLWILADLIYIPLYFYKGLQLTAVLYMVFLILCVAGLRGWQQSLAREKTGPHGLEVIKLRSDEPGPESA